MSFDLARFASRLHHLAFNLLLGLIVLHLLAVTAYQLGGENLIGAMVGGRMRLADGVVRPKLAPVWRLLPGLALAGGVAWLLWRLDQA